MHTRTIKIEKRCPRCMKLLPAKRFSPNGKTALRAQCKSCRNMEIHNPQIRISGQARIDNLIGRLVGKWLPLYPVYIDGVMRMQCQCECGIEKPVRIGDLRLKKSKQCPACYFSTPRTLPFLAAYNQLKSASKRRAAHINCDISFSEFKAFTTINQCHYCGVEILRDPHKSLASFLDRKDASKGYIASNLVVCCKQCNWVKSNRISYTDFMFIGDTLRFLRERSVAPDIADAPFIHTSAGSKIYPSQPLQQPITIEEIAKSLSKICRFTGNCIHFYSVGQHSCLVSDLCTTNKKWALCHEVGEMACSDVPRPIKHGPGMAAYRDYEKRITSSILAQFGLSFPEPENVKRADDIMLTTEQAQLMFGKSAGNVQKERLENITPLKTKINYWSPEKAEREFLKRFKKLTK